MKSIKPFPALCLLILMLFVCLSSCCQSSIEAGSTSNTSSADSSRGVQTSESKQKEPTSDIKIKDIVWSIDTGIINGERYLLLDFENKTPYPITYFELDFSEKSGIDEEQSKAFLENLEYYSYADEDYRNLMLSEGINMYTTVKMLIESKATVCGIHCNCYGYVTDATIMDFVQPDIATICYVKDNQIHTVYYDYLSEKFTVESNTENAHYWPDNHFADVLPSIEAPVTLENYGCDDDRLDIDIYGITVEGFDAYKAACIEKGFTTDSYEHDGYYSAENDTGYDLSLDYDEESAIMGILIYYRP